MRSDIVTPLIYLVHACLCQLSIKDKEELARNICHSVKTQAQYQFIHNPDKNLKSLQEGSESPTERV